MPAERREILILVDWGTSSFRAFRADATTVSDHRESGRGILQVQAGEFSAALREEIGPWLADGETRVLMSGMIGSRQGWVEAPYLDCPAGAGDLARGLASVPFEGADVKVVPGVRGADPAGVPEVMRGEETQIVGTLEQTGINATACLPGSHSKWVTISEGRITAFQTHMTGEAFAALRGHTILGRTMVDAPNVPAAFRRGVARAQEAGGLLHHLFGVRTLGLHSQLPETEAASYLSGLLIGHELRSAGPSGTVHLIGAPGLCALYALALEQFGAKGEIARPEAAASGLLRIAEHASWI